MRRYLSDGAQRYHRSCSPLYPFVRLRSPAASCDHNALYPRSWASLKKGQSTARIFNATGACLCSRRCAI